MLFKMHQHIFAIHKLNSLTPIVTLGLFQVLDSREVEVVTHRACPVALTSHSIAFYSPTTLPSPRISYLTTPTPTWATLLCNPLPTVTQLLSPHPRNQQMHTAHNKHSIYTESAHPQIHRHTLNIHRIGTSTQSVHSCQTLSVSQFGRGARMCANTSIRRTGTWQCVEELGIPLRNFFFPVDRKSAFVKRNTLTQALNCVKIFIGCDIDSSS